MLCHLPNTSGFLSHGATHADFLDSLATELVCERVWHRHLGNDVSSRACAEPLGGIWGLSWMWKDSSSWNIRLTTEDGIATLSQSRSRS